MQRQATSIRSDISKQQPKPNDLDLIRIHAKSRIKNEKENKADPRRNSKKPDTIREARHF
jgi:hypothetical protein